MRYVSIMATMSIGHVIAWTDFRDDAVKVQCHSFVDLYMLYLFANFYMKPMSATTVLSSVTLHMYRGQFDWHNLVFMNMHEAGETNIFPMKSHVTIKYSSITMTSCLDFLTSNRNQRTF